MVVCYTSHYVCAHVLVLRKVCTAVVQHDRTIVLVTYNSQTYGGDFRHRPVFAIILSGDCSSQFLPSNPGIERQLTD